MRYQANRDYQSDDVVMTPPTLCALIASHFQPSGRILEPCRGTGNFYRALKPYASELLWCEITKERDFFGFNGHVDWVITNPPWSLFRKFLQHAMKVADNVVFLVTVNHYWTKARVRDIREAEFALKEILLLDTPKEFPQTGFQLGAIHLRRKWLGKTTIQIP